MKRVMILGVATVVVLLSACGGSPPPEAEPVAEVEAPKPELENDMSSREYFEGPTPEGRRGGGFVAVKSLKVSHSVEVGTNVAIKPKHAFHRGIRKIYASFKVIGLEEGATIRVMWFQNENMIEEHDIVSEGEKRYSVLIEDKRGLADAAYKVEVEVEGEVMAGRTFEVGGKTISPVVDFARLGPKMGNNQMPKKDIRAFKTSTKKIHCGIRFLGLPDVAKVKVNWVHMAESGENILETTETEIEGGGTANAGLTFKPSGKLEVGQYKATVYLDGTKMEELSFTVE